MLAKRPEDRLNLLVYSFDDKMIVINETKEKKTDKKMSQKIR